MYGWVIAKNIDISFLDESNTNSILWMGIISCECDEQV